MHSIERYGIVALLFLVVTVVAVLMWDGDKQRKGKGVASASSATPASALDAKPAPSTKSAERGQGNQLTLVADVQPGPLARAPMGGSAEPTGGPRSEAVPDLESPWAEPAPLLPESSAGHALQKEERAAAFAPKIELRPEPPVVDHTLALAPSAGSSATHAYVVRSGDTLSEIAQHELGSAKRWQEIVASNPGLDPARLRAGQSIRLPGATARKNDSAQPAEGATQVAKGPKEKSEKSASNPSSSSKPATWKIGKGESLWKIAERSLGDGQRWREIAALNPALNPDKLVLGQVLVLPARGAAPKASSAGVASSGAPAKKSAPLVVASAADAPVHARRGGKVK